MLLLEKASQLRIELMPVHRKEISNEILAQASSRETLAGSHETSGRILSIFDKYGFCSLFYQAWLGNCRQVAQDELLKHGHLICKSEALDYNFKAHTHKGSERSCTLWTSNGSLRAQRIWKSHMRSHNWTNPSRACASFWTYQLSYSSTDFYSRKILMRLFKKTLSSKTKFCGLHWS